MITVADLSLDAHSSKLSGIQLIGAKLFQLTEWVYKVLSGPEVTPIKISLSEAIAVYTKCLNWYDEFFALLKADGINTPCILYIQYAPGPLISSHFSYIINAAF